MQTENNNPIRRNLLRKLTYPLGKDLCPLERNLFQLGKHFFPERQDCFPSGRDPFPLWKYPCLKGRAYFTTGRDHCIRRQDCS
jgi:hypothetical protein